MNALKHKYTAAREFVSRDLWILDEGSLPGMKRNACNLLKVGYIVVRGFIRDNCGLQASALTYVTLMSMVPVLALSFSVAKGLGAQQMLVKSIEGTLEALPEQVSAFVTNIFDLVERTNFVTIGAVGSVLLFWTVVKVLGRIEHTFNAVWGVTESRPLVRKFADYVSVLVFGPFLVILCSWLNITLSSAAVLDLLADRLGPIYIVVELAVKSVSSLGIVFAFSFVYAFIPNTKVKLSSAVVGGLTAGIIWLAWQWVCVRFQVGITRYNTIYGAFASLPIGLFWLYSSWLIILFGAEVSFAYQNFPTYTQESHSRDVGFAARERLAFAITYEICHAFQVGAGPWAVAGFQHEYRIPVRLLGDILDRLQRHHLIVEAEPGAYLPGKSPEILTLAEVFAAMSDGDTLPTALFDRNYDSPVLSHLATLDEGHRQALAGEHFRAVIEEGGEDTNGDRVPA